MVETIGVFVGSASSFNVTRLVTNIGSVLSEEFTVHLIKTNQSLSHEVREVYNDVFEGVDDASRRIEFRTLREYIRSTDPDILFQVTSPPTHGTIVGLLGKRYNIPVIYRYSGDRFYEYRLSQGLDKPIHFCLNNVLGWLPLQLADRFVTLGPTGARRLQARGVDEDQISIIPPIVDQNRFTPNGPQAKMDTSGPVALFVGRISRKKGKKTIERTLPEIVDKRPELTFVFLGRQIAPIDIPQTYRKNIKMIGRISPEDMPKYYRSASVLVHPSLTEGLPRAVLEALATGTPVVARDIGDVAFATENTFDNELEFTEMVCNFESLSVDSVKKFSYESVRTDYLNLFENV